MKRSTAVMLLVLSSPAPGAEPDIRQLQAEIAAARAQVAEQQRALDRQAQRLADLERRLLGNERMAAAAGPTQPTATGTAAGITPAKSDQGGIQPVGEAPAEPPTDVQLAVLSNTGGVITRRGQLTLEAGLEYAHADRNRVIFRGIEVPQSVLVGVFDINESRQDVLTATAGVRFGVTGRFELNARLPFIYRADKAVVAPIVTNPPGSDAGTRDYSVDGNGIGDIEFGARYQFTDGTGGWPYLIANISAVAPTGTSPFKVARSGVGQALKAATGAGFWGISPGVTAILPTDPAVLFGTIGYTVNLAQDIDRYIGDTLIRRVDPGDGPSASLGIGISLNQRTSISLGYAHQWVLGSKTVTQTIDRRPLTGPVLTDPVTNTTRDLQLGRLLFGVSYRTNAATTINWNVEVGATDDATDIRTTLRVPVNLR